jgi:hypothetical protein
MPTPTILPKPLSECSSAEIERIVWKSQADLFIPQPLQVDKPYLLNIPNTTVANLHLVPGGRWLLAGCFDGSVWWFDLDFWSSPEAMSSDAGGPKLLLESPLSEEASRNDTRIVFSVDHTSKISGAKPTSKFGTLENFNLAVFVSYLSRDLHHTKVNSFQVWKVSVVTAPMAVGSPSGIKACQCLSSFFEDSGCTIEFMSLHGANLAYSVQPAEITAVVNWHSVNGKHADHDPCFMRWLLKSEVGRVSLMHGSVAES